MVVAWHRCLPKALAGRSTLGAALGRGLCLKALPTWELRLVLVKLCVVQ